MIVVPRGHELIRYDSISFSILHILATIPVLLEYERDSQRTNTVNCRRSFLTWCIIKAIKVYVKSLFKLPPTQQIVPLGDDLSFNTCSLAVLAHFTVLINYAPVSVRLVIPGVQLATHLGCGKLCNPGQEQQTARGKPATPQPHVTKIQVNEVNTTFLLCEKRRGQPWESNKVKASHIHGKKHILKE